MLVPARVSVLCGQKLPADGVVIMPKPPKAHSFLACPRSNIWKCTAALFVCKSSLRGNFLYPLLWWAGAPTSAGLLSFHPPGSHSSGKVQKALPTCACLPFRLLFVRNGESLLTSQAQLTTGEMAHYQGDGLLVEGWLIGGRDGSLVGGMTH